MLNATEKEYVSTDNGFIGISVIIPVYNTAPYLRSCLDSILGQVYKQIEVICVNDGSTDLSGGILNEYAAKDARVKVFHQQNTGQGIARDEGFRKACGKYIYYMDSDDTLDTQALKYLFTEAEENKLDILYFDGVAEFETEQLEKRFSGYKTYYTRKNDYALTQSGPELFVAMHKHSEYRASLCLQLFRRQFLTEHNILFRSGVIYEDELYSLSCILRAGRVSHRKLAFFHRRIRENSTMTANIDFKSFYGRFRCYWSIRAFLEGKTFNEEVQKALCEELNGKWHEMLNKWTQLPPDEQVKINGLEPLERETFDKFVLPYAQNGGKSPFEAVAELKEVCSSVSYRFGRAATWLPRKLSAVASRLKQSRNH